MTLSHHIKQHLSTKNLLALLALCFFTTQPWDRHLADVFWLLLSLTSLGYVAITKYQGHSFNAQKALKTLLWLFALMPLVSVISYLASPLDTLAPTLLEPDTRWLLIIPIILALRDTQIGPKWVLLLISSYAISTFMSATIETNYLTNLTGRASGDENAVPYGMFNATIALMLLAFFINPHLNKLFRQEPNKPPKNKNCKNMIIRSLLLLVFTLSAIATFLSGTRAAVLLLPVVMIGLYSIHYPAIKALISLIILLGLGTVLIITQPQSAFVSKLISTPSTITSYFVINDRASKLKNPRLEQWKESKCIFTLHPLLGTGPRSFKYAHQAYGGEDHCNAVQYLKRGSYQAHSVYFNTLGTLGLTGMLTSLLLSLALLRTGINAFKQTNPTSKLGGSLLITVLACHAINGITLDLWFMNHVMNKNLLILALPLVLIFHDKTPSKSIV